MRDIIKLLTPKSWLNFIVIQNYISSLVKNCEETMVISTDTWVDFERRKHKTVMRWTKKNKKNTEDGRPCLKRTVKAIAARIAYDGFEIRPTQQPMFGEPTHKLLSHSL